MDRRTYCQGIRLKSRKNCLHEDLSQVISALDKDVTFLKDDEQDAHKKVTQQNLKRVMLLKTACLH
jgi:SpoU rRNA methylase family enzyme